jgi:hypothetical protein
MNTLLSRIREIAKKEGITVSYLEKQIGASKGVLTRAIKNNTDIQAKWLQIIVENYPLYSTTWLLTGIGEKNILSEGLHSYSSTCLNCEQKEQRISDLLETIASLKDANATLKDLVAVLKGKIEAYQNDCTHIETQYIKKPAAQKSE